jgi:hypothetical protein
MIEELQKIQALGAPAWYIEHVAKNVPFSSAHDLVAPLVLALGHSQADTRKASAQLAAAEEQSKLRLQAYNDTRVERDILKVQVGGLQQQLVLAGASTAPTYVGSLQGVPFFTHTDILGAAKKALEQAYWALQEYPATKQRCDVLEARNKELETKLAAAERTMKTALHMEEQADFRVGDLKREVERLQDKLATAERELGLTKAARDTQQYYAKSYQETNNRLTKELADAKALTERWCQDFHDVKKDLDEARANEKKWGIRHDEQLALHLKAKDLAAQAVKAKDAAVEQAKDWKRKYQARKALDFAQLYGASPIKVLSRCHDEITVSQEDAKKLVEQYKKEFPGIWSYFHPEHKNLVDTGPQQLRVPKADPGPRRQHPLPESSMSHNWHKDIMDSLRVSIDYAQAEKQVLAYCNMPLELLKPSAREQGQMLHKTLEMYFGAPPPAPKPLTIRVSKVEPGVWLWHDKEHPSRIFRTWHLANDNMYEAESVIGNTWFVWYVQQGANGYVLTERKWKH